MFTNRQYLNRQDLGTPGSSVNIHYNVGLCLIVKQIDNNWEDANINAFGQHISQDGDHINQVIKFTQMENVTTDRG